MEIKMLFWVYNFYIVEKIGMLQTECLCPSQICTVKPNLQWDGIWKWGYGRRFGSLFELTQAT